MQLDLGLRLGTRKRSSVIAPGTVAFTYKIGSGSYTSITPPDTIALGTITSKSVTVQITNSGNPSTVESATIGGDSGITLDSGPSLPQVRNDGEKSTFVFTTPAGTGAYSDTITFVVNGQSYVLTVTYTVAEWYNVLVSDIEAATSATCVHAVFVGASTTTKNVGGDPATDGDRIYKIFDLKAGAYDYIEGASSKGGVYRAASVGTRAAMQLDRTNSEYLKTTKNANAATPNLIPAGNHTAIVVGKFSDNNVNSSTARFNPLIWGSNDMSGAAAAAPSLLLRDDTTNRIHGYDAGGSLIQITSTPAPYDTPLVLSLRNKRDPSGVIAVGSNKTYQSTAANADVTSLAKLFHTGLGADYLSGHIAAVIVLNAYIDDTTMDSVTDIVNAAFGI